MAQRTLIPYKLLGWLIGVVGVLLLVVIGLNFAVVSCAPFSCSQKLSWWSDATGGSGDCPSSLRGAMEDKGWAADRLAEISEKHVTTGLFYDEDGTRHELDSSDENGQDAQLARKILAELGIGAASDGTYPVATHVEVKIAAQMRVSGVKTGVLVINNKRVCLGDRGLSCQELLPTLLPSGTWLRVWHPTKDGSDIVFEDFRGN